MPHEAASREALSRTMSALYQRGWCDGTGGNFSCVLSRDPLRLLMAPSGVPKGEVAPEALIVVNGQGEVVQGNGHASAETRLHLEILERCGAGAVLHTHSQAATLLAQRLGRWRGAELLLEGLEMLKGLAGITTHATGVALPVLPNDQDLDALSAAARPRLPLAPHGLLIAGHGLYAWGADLAEAHRHLEILEFLLEQRWRQLLLEPHTLQPRLIEGISHVLLDIEGTTCPIAFVSKVLFPYAAAHLEEHLNRQRGEAALTPLLEAIDQAWQADGEAQAAGLVWQVGASPVPYLHWLIAQDRKLTALKDLQGLIWREGYSTGQLRGQLFADVPAALTRWQQEGAVLAVYSSGSVAAQQLLYGHSNAGDLRGVFAHWFDTRVGAKQDAESYQNIAKAMAVEPSRVLFISDAVAELEAAESVGMRVLRSDREGNPDRDNQAFERIHDLSCLQIAP